MKVKFFIYLLVVAGIISMTDNARAQSDGLQKAIFAGGCFWCVEAAFEKVDGVVAAVSGYTDGQKVDPTYQEVSSGRTGHAEAVEVTFDPAKVTYAELLTHFWHNIDPTQKNGQFADKGTQYRTAIYYFDGEQKAQAEKSKAELAASGKFDKPIVVEIKPAQKFYPAEEYHQDY
ncbi:MAG: peptide-methionine (S)-S-oxide reductase MsrA, partial [Candidatus Omnitrophica bacterium]|nr:peptide-methionine (S)-S-oxide reductase MsrA [Candidatus Omnitrophota bacterium]